MTQTLPHTTENVQKNNDVKIERVSAEHYKMLSFSAARIYNLTYNNELSRWQCDCPDTRYNKNDCCKHLIVFRVWIKAAEAEKRAQAAEAAALEEQTKRESLQSQVTSLAFSIANVEEEQSTLLQCALIEIELLKREQAREQKAHVEVSASHDAIIAELRYEEFPQLKSMVAQEALDNDFFKEKQREFNAKIESRLENQKSINSSNGALIVSLKKENRDQQEQINQQAAELKEIREAIGQMQQEREQASLLIQASAQLIQAMSTQQAPPQKRITITVDGEKVRTRRTTPTTTSKRANKGKSQPSTELAIPEELAGDPGAIALAAALQDMASDQKRK